ncbi:shikimate kinase [Mycobacterium adipatum]|uniref:shikimate kinase n=1 Tax=Mycobacterium adipatum TaxID=1682113 RepID=UPI0034E08ACB
MAPKAVLVGMPGSGKSTIGRRLAKALGVPLLDTDAKIVETTGSSIADIFVQGEAHFRQIEADVVRAALNEHDGVVSLGGGAVTTPEVREALKGHTVIYLEISAAEGIRRTTGSARPLLAGDDPAAKYRALMDERVPLFRAGPTWRHTPPRRKPGGGGPHCAPGGSGGGPARPPRRRRPAWRRGPTVLNPAPTTEAPPTPAALAKRAEARNE